MKGLFLQAAATVDSNILEAILGLVLAIVIAIMVTGLIIYIYMALAFMKIAKRTNTNHAWMAWIPILNLFLLARIAGMHWWPILLLFAGIIIAPISGAIVNDTVALLFGITNGILLLIFGIYSIIWQWKVFKAVGRPGWWVLFVLIPIIGWLIYLVLLGVAAWGHSENQVTQIKKLNKII